MINEKELRVGNIYLSKRNKDIVVKAIDTINKVVVIDEPDLDLGSEQPYIFEDLDPIPLSLELLAKVGFTKNGDDAVFKRKIDCEKDCAFIEFEGEGCYLKDRDRNKIGKQIEYLHQLQNAYFFLTGNELKG